MLKEVENNVDHFIEMKANNNENWGLRQKTKSISNSNVIFTTKRLLNMKY